MPEYIFVIKKKQHCRKSEQCCFIICSILLLGERRIAGRQETVEYAAQIAINPPSEDGGFCSL